MNTFRARLVLTFLFSTLAATGFAQTTVSGRVTDPDRAAVADVPVALTPIPTGARVTTRTQNDGTFAFPRIAPGRYQLEINAPGFAAWTEDVTLEASARTVDASLQIATLSEDVTVRANAIISSIGKTAAPLRDQPLTVNRITADYLQSQGVNDLVVALQTVGNVNSWNQYGVYESTRSAARLVQLVDGIRNEGNRVRTQLSNVESIEILKGPASVLYGSDAVGGTVNIVLKKPSPQPAYDFAASVGSWKTVRSAFGATGRLGSDALLYRFDFGSDSSDNFRHDPWDKINATPTVSWRLGPHDLFDFRYSLNRNSLSGDGGIPQVTRPDGTIFIPDVPRERRYNTPDDFALSYDHNIRSSYTHSFPNGFGVRNVFAGRLFDDYTGWRRACDHVSQHGEPDVPDSRTSGGPGGTRRSSRASSKPASATTCWPGGTIRTTRPARRARTRRRWRRRRSISTTRSRPPRCTPPSRRRGTTIPTPSPTPSTSRISSPSHRN